MNGKKILIIVENLPVPFDRRVWMESTTLKKNGYDVSVICPKGKGFEKEYEQIDGVHIYRHNLPTEKSTLMGYIREYASALWSQLYLARLIYRKNGFSILHACNPPDLIFLVAWWFKLFHGTKFIFDHHDLNPELYESKFNKRGFFYRILLWAERLSFISADIVISTNQSYKEIAIGRGGKNPDRVFIVRSGPSLDKFKPVDPDPVYKNGRRYLVGYLGVMAEFDGVDHLVRAAGEIIKTHKRTDVQFCLIGSGPMHESLKELAVNLDIVEYLNFPGKVSDAEMIKRLCTCDVCVDCDPLNPLNDKSTMNKILEYMALRKPVVQYDLKEGRRSAMDASLYAIPNDIDDLAGKIIQLLDDPESRERMGNIGRKRMEEQLEWRYQIPHLLKAYVECR